MTTAIEKSPSKITTGKVRLSYANVWQPKKAPGSEKETYSTAILIDKQDKETLAKIEIGVKFLTEEAKKKYGGKLPKNFKLPLRDGDEEKPEAEEYEGKMFLNASSKNKPGIVSREKDEKGNFKEITDPAQVYSGCYARVSINLFLFDTNGNKGIGVGLNNIQKIADGEPLAGGSSPETDFDDDFEDDLENDPLFK